MVRKQKKKTTDKKEVIVVEQGPENNMFRQIGQVGMEPPMRPIRRKKKYIVEESEPEVVVVESEPDEVIFVEK